MSLNGLCLFCPNCGSALEDTFNDLDAELKELKRGNTISLEICEVLYFVDSGFTLETMYKAFDKSKYRVKNFMSRYCRDFPGEHQRDAEDYMFKVIRREKTDKKHKYSYKPRGREKVEAVSEVERIYITMDNQFRKFPHNRIKIKPAVW